MKRTHYLLVTTALFAGLLIGCATTMPQSDTSVFAPYAFRSDDYAAKVDTFMITLDASSSMSEPYGSREKFEIAKDFLAAMNQSIPDLSLDGGLISFGHSQSISKQPTQLFYGVAPYSQSGLASGLDAVAAAGGTSPLSAALSAAGGTLKAASGQIALIVVSDGRQMGADEVAAAKELKRLFGDRLCIYTVLVGDDAAGERLLEQVAAAGECGFAVRADSFTGAGDMKDFVKSVFLTERIKPLDSDGDGVTDDMDQCPGTPAGVAVDGKGCPLDSDGDGVYDYMDQCPGTPAGVAVDARGCPLDSDGDGVYDYMDQCPGTPAGVAVDGKGCPLDSDGDGVYNDTDQCPDTPQGAHVNQVGCWILEGVLFDSAKWRIKPEAYPELSQVIRVLRNNPTLNVEVQGHTDNRGSKTYNQKLSENRAKAVMNYLVDKGISAGRLSAKGFGFNRPFASNDTPEGRAMNRRVELKPLP